MIMKKTSGFTLIELMVLIGLFGILVALAIPSFNYLTDPEKIKSAARELHSGLHVARSEAIRWNKVTCVCPSADATAVSPSCASNGKWETGWLAFIDEAGTCEFNGADRLVKTWDGSTNGLGITIRNDDASITSINFIRYNPRGQALRLGGAAQKGTFTVCDTHALTEESNGVALYARGVDLHTTGRARITNYIASLDATNCPVAP